MPSKKFLRRAQDFSNSYIKTTDISTEALDYSLPNILLKENLEPKYLYQRYETTQDTEPDSLTRPKVLTPRRKRENISAQNVVNMSTFVMTS